MAKALLYLDENLASSIALKYVDYLSSIIELNTSIIHVVDISNAQPQKGNSRKLDEVEMIKEGEATISRLLKTEKVKYGFNGQPKIKLGNKTKEVLQELQNGSYDLFIEGHLPLSEKENFAQVVSTELYQKCPCSILYVKNLSISNIIAVLLSSDVKPEQIASTLGKMLKNSEMETELIHYDFKDVDHLEFLETPDNNPIIAETASLLAKHGLKISTIHNVVGTPEAIGDFLMSYAFVASSFSTSPSYRFEALSQTQNSVLLCKG